LLKRKDTVYHRLDPIGCNGSNHFFEHCCRIYVNALHTNASGYDGQDIQLFLDARQDTDQADLRASASRTALYSRVALKSAAPFLFNKPLWV
jgi:hypothetical protein